MIFNKSFKEKAYAKINLYLDVTARRTDGYHNIRSVMQTVSLCDMIELELTETVGDFLTCNVKEIPTDGSNLAIKAVNAFRNAMGAYFGTRIHIEKNIPSCAGMAGGSSDAAAVLRLLQRLLETDIPNEKMIEIAASIGADVPFCFLGGTMLAEDRGERLTALSPCPKMHCVAVIKGEGISTPWAYSRLDAEFGDFSSTGSGDNLDALICALQKSDRQGIKNNLYNIFEAVVEPERPEIGKLKRLMLSCGASSVLMSGSGPSVFGIFEDEASAKKALETISEYGADAYYCTT